VNTFEPLLRALVTGGVEFIVVGGVAAAQYGSARIAYDIDILYHRTTENIERLTAAVAPLHPYLRGAPPGLPFKFDVETVRRGLNFTLSTDAGPLDCLGEISGVGGYSDAVTRAADVDVFGLRCRFLSLEDLIAAKRASGRSKDLETLAELEVIREKLRSLG